MNGWCLPDGTPPHYQIRVSGTLEPHWSAWFAGLTITHTDDGTTLLAGPLIDQPALHGVRNRIRDLGLTLLEVRRER